MGKTSIVYGNMAVNAPSLFTATATYKQAQSDMANLVRAEPLAGAKIGTVIEDSMMVLSNGWEFAQPGYQLPPNRSWGYIYDDFTEDDGTAPWGIQVRLTSPKPVTSPGITIVFDEAGQAWATDIAIRWMRNGVQIDRKQYAPTSTIFYAENTVTDYDQVILIIYAWSLPRRFVRINNVQFGTGVIIDRLMDVSVRQEVSPVGAELAINTLEFTTSIVPGQSFGFQRGQKVDCFFDDQLVGTFLIQAIERPTQNNYTVRAVCYLSMLDAAEHTGGIYVRKSAQALAQEICDVVGAPMSFEATDTMLTGWLPYASCRENLAQVCFAAGYLCDTSFANVIRIFPVPEEADHILNAQEIFMAGTKISEVELPRSVSLAAHSYAPGDPVSDSDEIFSAEKTGTIGRVNVVFDAAYGDLSITNGTIIDSGDNYAIIDAGVGCVLSGTPYIDIKMYQGITTAEDSTKQPVVVDVPSLVSKDNVNNLLNNLYSYYRNPYSAKLKTTNSGIRCGHMVGIMDTYMGSLLGIVEKMEFRLNGTKLFPTITISSKPSNILEGYPRAGELFAGEAGLW